MVIEPGRAAPVIGFRLNRDIRHFLVPHDPQGLKAAGATV
jgi:hypothetical protein